MNSEIKKILNKIEKNGYEAYIVGGFVRDYLLNRKSNDIDICTNALPKTIQSLFGNSSANGCYGSYNFKTNKYNYDITTYRKESNFSGRNPTKIEYTSNLIEDLKRRDFTINAICMNTKGKIIDLLNGTEDIKKRVIRTIGKAEKRITEDPLRILRAIRFSCTLNFELDEELKQAILKHKEKVFILSKTRIKKELDSILLSKNFAKGLEELNNLGILNYLDIKFKKMTYVNDLNGMWAQMEIKDYTWFTKNEKKQIDIMKQILQYETITPWIIYQYGLYPAMVANKIKNGSKKDIIKIYKKMGLENRKDLKITFKELMDITKKTPKEVKQIEENIIKLILDGKLKNKKELIIKFLEKESDEI